MSETPDDEPTDTTTPGAEEPPAVAPAPDDNADRPDAPEPRLLDAREIRARRRPRAIFFVWAWELACAFVIATPIHAWAKAAFGARPDGDAAVFRPGGFALLSWLGEQSSSLSIVVRTTLVAILVFGVLGQLVTGTLVASLATGIGTKRPGGRAPGLAFALRAGTAAFFPLLGISVIAAIIQIFIVGTGIAVSSAIDHALDASAGDARAFDVRLAVVALFVVGALVVGVVSDLARVSVVRSIAGDHTAPAVATRYRMRDAAVAAIRSSRRAIGRATLAWGWRAALSLALIWVGARAGDTAGARAGATLWLLFVTHQLIVLARTGLRASWLANALRLVERRDATT